MSIPLENKEKCLEAVPGLILMLQSEDNRNQNIAARAICNISKHPNTNTSIIEQGTLPPLIALLEQENNDVKEVAMVALVNICTTHNMKAQLVENGVLPPLFALLEHSEEGIKESSVNFLASLVTTQANHAPMIDACSFPVLVNEINTGPTSLKERCVFIISTLSYEMSGCQDIVDAGTVAAFKNILGDDNSSKFSKELAVALYANICCVKKAQTEIVNEGVVPLLMKFAQEEKPNESEMKKRVGWVLQNIRHLMIRKSTVPVSRAPLPTPPNQSTPPPPIPSPSSISSQSPLPPDNSLSEGVMSDDLVSRMKPALEESVKNICIDEKKSTENNSPS